VLVAEDKKVEDLELRLSKISTRSRDDSVIKKKTVIDEEKVVLQPWQKARKSQLVPKTTQVTSGAAALVEAQKSSTINSRSPVAPAQSPFVSQRKPTIAEEEEDDDEEDSDEETNERKVQFTASSNKKRNAKLRRSKSEGPFAFKMDAVNGDKPGPPALPPKPVKTTSMAGPATGGISPGLSRGKTEPGKGRAISIVERKGATL
jgi:hypothetical protein